MADAVTYLQDGRRTSSMRVDSVSPLEGSFTAPSKTSVISRNQPILVQRQSETSTDLLAMESVGEITPGAIPAVLPAPDREAPSNVQADAEDTVGVQPTVRASSVLQPATAPGAPQVIREVNPHVMRSSPQAAPASATTVQTVRKKVRVRISNPAMGKMTVTVQSVAVSDSLVILAYPKDADSIIEPPEADVDNPIQVDVGEQSYKCMSGSWTADLEGLFLVVLVRLRD